MMNDPAISALGLSKHFGEKVAVVDFSLQVPAGEVFGFLGPNGAGKTTSVKMLLGLTRPSAGSASLLGQPLNDIGVRKRVGFLPEHFRFHEWLRAGEFLDLHARLFGMPANQRAVVVPRLLKMVGLEKRINTRLSAFSKGMLQRIGLAQALLNNPELVFMDEPTSGLDPLGRRLVRDIIRDLRARNITVFLNSHLLSEIELTCDRVAFIRAGTILKVATLAELEEESLQLTLRVGRPDLKLLEGLSRFGSEPFWGKDNGRIHMGLTDEEQIPALVTWLIEEGQELYELSPRRLSLEEQFLKIVGDEMHDA